jgi:hypothetical protein
VTVILTALSALAGLVFARMVAALVDIIPPGSLLCCWS